MKIDKKSFFFGGAAALLLAGVVFGFSVYGARGFNLLQPFDQLNQAVNQVGTDLKNSLLQSLHLQSINQASSSSSLSLENQSSPLPVSPQVASYEEQVIKVVQNTNPSVVSIIISKNVPIIEQYYVNPFQDFGIEVPPGFGIPQYRQKGTQKQEIGGGTGFIISSDGLIVTNKHVVVDTAADYTVLFNDGTKLPATVVARDPVLDLAIIRVNKTGLKPLALGDSDSLQLGQSVIAIGNALGEFRNTVSVGVVSGLERTLQVQGETLTKLIQTDAAINPGNSGGPLLDLHGQVMGINVAMATGAQSIGFAIPINQVKKAIGQVEATGAIKTAFLGVRYQLVNADLKQQKNLPVDYGALIISEQGNPGIVAGSPADKAGLKEGDIILEFGGEHISEQNPLTLLIKKYNPGETVDLKVLRANQDMNVSVTLGER